MALKDADLSIEAGEIVALMGPSGSGKTTLLRALSLIDPPTSGQITIDNEVVFEGTRVLTDDRQLRRKRMGIIFQAYNFIPFLTTVENVALVLTLNGVSSREALTRAQRTARASRSRPSRGHLSGYAVGRRAAEGCGGPRGH